jgi:arsenate reductase-like glutaredoxin family protein
MIDLDPKKSKIVVGSALLDCIESAPYDKTLLGFCNDLRALYDSAISIEEIKRLHNKLVKSSNPNQRDVGFALEPALGFNQPEKDWRDLAIEMMETELSLFDIFYRITTLKEQKYQTSELLEWLNEIGSSVSCMRSSDWINAKKHANKAFELSRKDSIKEIIEDEYLGGAIVIYQKATARYFEETKQYPVTATFPEDRLDIIVELQAFLLKLEEKYQIGKPSKVLSDVILYPIEKIGTAIEYLMNSNEKIERANYEIGLACEHFKEKIGNLRGKEERDWANSIYEPLEVVFSKLPVEPRSVTGFGNPGVESRFENEHA